MGGVTKASRQSPWNVCIENYELPPVVAHPPCLATWHRRGADARLRDLLLSPVAGGDAIMDWPSGPVVLLDWTDPIVLIRNRRICVRPVDRKGNKDYKISEKR